LLSTILFRLLYSPLLQHHALTPSSTRATPVLNYLLPVPLPCSTLSFPCLSSALLSSPLAPPVL
jgi:hypothetical protein